MIDDVVHSEGQAQHTPLGLFYTDQIEYWSAQENARVDGDESSVLSWYPDVSAAGRRPSASMLTMWSLASSTRRCPSLRCLKEWCRAAP